LTHKTYIASPFFTPVQLKEVTLLESVLGDSVGEYFSPRKTNISAFSKIQAIDGEEAIDFEAGNHPLSESEYMEIKRKVIFIDNIGMISECQAMIANLRHVDIGTIFEAGYFWHRVCIGEKLFSDFITLTSPESPTGILDRWSLVNTCNSNFEDLGESSSQLLSSCMLPDSQNMLLTFMDNELSLNVQMEMFIRMIDRKCKGSSEVFNVCIDMTKKDSFIPGFFLMGYLKSFVDSFRPTLTISFISPFVSKSNLMITSMVKGQYKTPEDYHNDSPVSYENTVIE